MINIAVNQHKTVMRLTYKMNRYRVEIGTRYPTNAKGFSPTTLKYAVYFYELYKDFMEGQNRPQLVDDLRKISWGHHRFIIDKCKNSPKKAIFFVKKTIQNNWSRATPCLKTSNALCSNWGGALHINESVISIIFYFSR